MWEGQGVPKLLAQPSRSTVCLSASVLALPTYRPPETHLEGYSAAIHSPRENTARDMGELSRTWACLTLPRLGHWPQEHRGVAGPGSGNSEATGTLTESAGQTCLVFSPATLCCDSMATAFSWSLGLVAAVLPASWPTAFPAHTYSSGPTANGSSSRLASGLRGCSYILSFSP